MRFLFAQHTLTGHIGKVYAAKFTVDSHRAVSHTLLELKQWKILNRQLNI